MVDFVGLQVSNKVPHQVLGNLGRAVLLDELLDLEAGTAGFGGRGGGIRTHVIQWSGGSLRWGGVATVAHT